MKGPELDLDTGRSGKFDLVLPNPPYCLSSHSSTRQSPCDSSNLLP
jgi:hypothetical protein